MRSSNKVIRLTRRRFVAVGALGGAAAVIGCTSLRQGDWEFLSTGEARTLAALCDQIVPADDFPSASQAGVLAFIDRQLVRHFRRYRDAYREGLERAEALSRTRFGQDLASLTSLQQVEIVRALEQQNPTFFNLMVSHTLDGYYGSPRHGGNRDAISWRMLGLSEPPLRGRAQYDLRKGTPS